MRDVILVIDGNNLCWTVGYVFRGLSFFGRPTGVLYGFFRNIISVCDKHSISPVAIAFCWDSKKLKRQELYPDYKANRSPTDEEDEAFRRIVYTQINHIRDDILPEIGFKNNFLFEGYESDDIIANIVLQYKKVHNIVVLSSDNDLWQLLDRNVSIISVTPRRKGTVCYTLEWFVETYGIEPFQWAEVKAIAGCSTDNVTGVSGIGEKRAIQYLRGELSDTYVAKIQNASDIVERNRKLVKLPFDYFDVQLYKHTASHSRYRAILAEYGLKSLQSAEMLEKATKLFRLV